MIDRTYGHLAADAEDYERALLDAYDAKTETVWARIGRRERRLGFPGTLENPCSS